MSSSSSSSSLVRKFAIVMWKNGKLKLRHWVVTLFEILVPSLLFVLLVFMRAQIVYDPGTKPPTTFRFARN